MYILTHEPDVTSGQFIKWRYRGLNSEFSFKTGCPTKVKELSLSYNFPKLNSDLLNAYLSLEAASSKI